MKNKEQKNYVKRGFSLLLSLAVSISGLGYIPGTEMAAEAAGPIQISSAADLKKIGKDAEHPMNGDYELVNDIDLGGENWTPIGGASGEKYGLVSGNRVFSGTFDGKGHSISGLTINYDGRESYDATNQSGLFAMIGSDLASDYAEVRNITFTDVNITHILGQGDTIGTLSGDVNGFAQIDNIAVMGGTIMVKGSDGIAYGDLIGAGGVVGQVRTNHSAVQMSNLYNAANITVEQTVVTQSVRCGGILGRIHQSEEIGSLASCLNVGKVTWKGGDGYAINGYSDSPAATSNTANVSNCFYKTGTGNDFGAATGITEAQMSTSVVDALGSDYWKLSADGKIIPAISEGKVTTPIPSPVFAEGDSISSVTKDFTLPLTYTTETGEENITWTSSNPQVISISEGTATVSGVLADTNVVLTATAGDRTKNFTVTVVSSLEITLDQEYAKAGTPITASVANVPEGSSFTYQWTIDERQVSNTASYTPKTEDLNKFLTVTATLTGSQNATLVKRIYCSKLPVVYIDTDDGYGITSKEVYKGATMQIQGNDKYNTANTTLYDGAISIRGRGNSTWNPSYNKLPYKIKLDTKTDLFGFGTSKHWTLLANYMDESLIRNTTSYDLSGEMGMVDLPSAHVDVILNGTYAGNYQLVGNVRIEESRVNIYDWEDLAGDVAKAIGKKEGIKGDARDALEDYLNEHMEWITSDTVTYQGNTYKISDYYTDIPKNADGTVNVSGGFLFELDGYYDEYSKFRTDYDQPIMFKSPEFVSPYGESGLPGCPALYSYANQYIQAVEDSIHATDFYVNVTEQAGVSNASNFTKDFAGPQHYTDLVDMDSLVNYFMLNEFFWNTETMKKSTFMYKDLNEKMYIGPVWDMDWTSNSIVSEEETSNPSVWMTLTRGSEAQKEQWYKYLIGDPYFVTKVYECYKANRQNFEDIVKTGGIIDVQKAYLSESAQANYAAGYLLHRSDFETETERLRTFLKNRLAWMDQQFTTVDTLLTSLATYQKSNSITVSADTKETGNTTYTAAVTDSRVSKVGFYINGILKGTADVTNGTASLTTHDSNLERVKGKLNVVQVRGMDASGNFVLSSNTDPGSKDPASKGFITNYTAFEKEIPVDALSGTVTISGTPVVGSVLTAALTDSNNTGTLAYQWYADGVEISGADSETYQITEADLGKKIKVVVSSNIETGSLESRETGAVTGPVEIKNDHLIINQVYGGGANDGTPVTHSFIEIYNPTDQEINLNRYSLGYLSGGKNGKSETEVKLDLDGAKSIPAHASYLVRCEAQDASTPELITLDLNGVCDQEWSQTIDNKRFRLILYKGDKIEDGVSVNEDPVEGDALADGAISKQKAIRRKDFADTNNNQADFETVTYKKEDVTEDEVSKNRPRSLADGSWDGTEKPVKPDDKAEVKQELNSVLQSIPADAEAGKYTVESWKALQTAVQAAEKVLGNPDSSKDEIQKVLTSLKAAFAGLKKADLPTPPADTEKKSLTAPSITSVKSVIRSGDSNVAVKVSKVDGAASYRIYRKTGSKVTLLGTTANGTYYDTKPVNGKAAYLAEAVNGTVVSAKSAEVSITLPKATAKVSAKAAKSGSKRTVKVTWKRVKGATQYMIFRSMKSNSGFKKIAVVKKAKTVTYTDKKVKKGKKYFYRVVAVKKKVYSPSKKSKAVKVK